MTKQTILKVERDGNDTFVDVIAEPTELGIILAKIITSLEPLDQMIALSAFAYKFSKTSKNGVAKVVTGTPKKLEEFLKSQKTANEEEETCHTLKN